MSADARRVGIASVLFWCCLFGAAGLYASVALAPRLLRHLHLQREHDENQLKLVTLERQVEYLEQVKDALESDPQFAAELARIEFDAFRPGDERIPVEQSLSLDAGKPRLPRMQFESATAWYFPLIEALATRRRLSGGLLAVASVLTVFAFAFLRESSPRAASAADDAPRPSILRRLGARYRKTDLPS